MSIRMGTAQTSSNGLHARSINQGIGNGRATHHRFFGGKRFPRNKFWYGSFIESGTAEIAGEAPLVSVAPPPSADIVAVDRPPCQETTAEGVVIARGSSCSRGAR